jgi:hypothetical protein
LQRLGALQERHRGEEAAVAASGSVAGALHRRGSSSCSVQERCRGRKQPFSPNRVLELIRNPKTPFWEGCRSSCIGEEAAVAASRSVAEAGKQQLQRPGALQRPGSSSCSVWERCRSVIEARKQQLQRPGALQERCIGEEAAVAASRSVAEAGKQQLQRPGALQRPGSSSCQIRADMRRYAQIRAGTPDTCRFTRCAQIR